MFTLLDLLGQPEWTDPRSVPSMIARHDCGLDVLPAAAHLRRSVRYLLNRTSDVD